MNNYFSYFPVSPREELWGASVTGTGFSRIKKGAAYPFGKHPADHHFTWERGRILHAFALVLISDGEGILEMEEPRRAWRVKGGDLFVVFPGVWHRYAPASETGWVEHWLVVRGRVFEDALRDGLISPERPVHNVNADTDLLDTMRRIHNGAHQDTAGNQDVRSTLAVHALSLLVRAADNCPGPAQAQIRLIHRARRLIMDRLDGPLNLTEIAREVGVGYTRFRQLFRVHSGQSAREFHTQARMQWACDLLTNTNLSVKEVADVLGFSSAFHFSASFKTARGVSPSGWKRKAAARGDSREITGSP